MSGHSRPKPLPFLFLIICLLVSAPGCLATRSWVTEQLSPVLARLSGVETRLAQTEAQAATTQTRLDHLQVERQLVLSLKDGVTFASDSVVVTLEARRQLDGFLRDLPQPESAVFMVAGHSDGTGAAEYNYELGQRRAANVARYLIVQKGLDPSRVQAVSYGAGDPIAENATVAGRRQNRRVEIMVYRERITAGQVPPQPQAQQSGLISE
jgi:outer membrane protein OmpA-like peptidoglycan-associated protein